MSEELRDKYGQTAEEWGKDQFEFENCYECGKDWDQHDYILILGGWFARCKDEETEEVLTIFRKYRDGEIIAVFPELEGSPQHCLSYVHVGQHGSADYYHVINTTKKATPKEYNDLKTELESIGYVLKIRQKWMRGRR